MTFLTLFMSWIYQAPAMTATFAHLYLSWVQWVYIWIGPPYNYGFWEMITWYQCNAFGCW